MFVLGSGCSVRFVVGIWSDSVVGSSSDLGCSCLHLIALFLVWVDGELACLLSD